MFEEDSGPEVMPEPLRRAASRAVRRMQRKPLAPRLAIDIPEDSSWWDYSSPYTEADLGNWYALLCDAFGTRLSAIADTFINQLASLCPTEWCPDKNKWKPTEDALRTAIAIVASTKPKNELDAALAAQMVAIHFATMKVGADIARRSYVDTRTVNCLAATVKASAMLADTLRKRRSKGSSIKQTIRVEKHVHQHIHIEQGGAEIGGKPHGARGSGGLQKSDAEELERRAQVPGEEPSGAVVRLRRDAG